MSADRTIQFTKAVGLKFSLATFGMLEDMLLKISGKTRKSGGDRSSVQSHLFSGSGSTFFESVASRCFYSLLTIRESVSSDASADVHVRQTCSIQQADAALGFSQTQRADITECDSSKSRADSLRC